MLELPNACCLCSVLLVWVVWRGTLRDLKTVAHLGELPALFALLRRFAQNTYLHTQHVLTVVVNTVTVVFVVVIPL